MQPTYLMLCKDGKGSSSAFALVALVALRRPNYMQRNSHVPAVFYSVHPFLCRLKTRLPFPANIIPCASPARDQLLM